MRILIVLAVVAAIIGGADYALSDADGETTYLTAQIEKGKVTDIVTTTGAVNAVVTVEVGSQLSGRIDELYVDFNDAVSRGQKLARLDQSSFDAKVAEANAVLNMAQVNVRVRQAGVERAKIEIANAEAQRAVLGARIDSAMAELRTAEADLKRKIVLREKGSTSVQSLEEARGRRDGAAAAFREAEAVKSAHAQVVAGAKVALSRAQAELARAEAEVPQARARLGLAAVEMERTVIRSPIDGVVIKRNVDMGQTVAASLEAPTIFTIAQDLREMEVHARIDEADIGRIAVGQRAVFSVDAFPGRQFAGTVSQTRKAPERVNSVVAYTVLIRTSNPDVLLLPGMTAIVRIITAETGPVLKVPNAALRFRPTDVATYSRRGEATGAGGKSASAYAAIRRVDSAGRPDSAEIRADLGGSSGTAAADEEAVGAYATIWVLDSAGRPNPAEIRTGLTDIGGAEVVSGNLSEGDVVIVGESVSTAGRRFFGLRLGL